MMRRRDFVASLAGATAWPCAQAWAQQIDRVRRVGILLSGTDSEPIRTALPDELAKLGWIENQNVQLDFRFGYADERRTNAVAATW